MSGMVHWILISICICFGFSTIAAGVAEWHTLTDGSGGKLVARFEGKQGNHYLLRRKTDGKLFEVSPELLLPADRTSFDQAVKQLDEEITKLNATAGHALFTGIPFESRPAEEIAQALKLRAESSTRYNQSWRLYASHVKGYRLFGAMPYSVALHADAEGNASSLSVVYANKGDFGSKAGEAEEHFKGGTEATDRTLAEAMERDEYAVAETLVKVLGPGASERFGEGKSRRTIRRWDWNGHSFLLSSEEGEYVSLLVVPLDFAEGGGRTASMKDGELRDRLRQSVVRELNGDVYLSRIPMVNQGPKGYCVPATFERAMRTMGIDADMYLLAMIGESQMGGGTSVERLLENVRSAIHRKGRRTKDEKIKDLRIRDVKRYIDEGVPVMWTMMSVSDYNKAANENTAIRKSVTDWSAYAKEIAVSAAAISKQDKPDDAHHICMIVGYNEATNEFAMSDSWGPSYERRWVPVDVANWVSQGGIFMILP